MKIDQLLNKPYVNGFYLTEQNLSLKCCQSLEQNLSLTIFPGAVVQRAAKLKAVKVGGLKKNSGTQQEVKTLRAL